MYTIKNILNKNYKKWYNKPYIYTKKEGQYQYKTFGQLTEDSIYLAEFLNSNGFKNSNIIIYGENSYEWMVADVAVTGFCGISVGVDKEWKSRDVAKIIDRVSASAMIYSEQKQDVIESLKEKYPEVKFICMQKDLPEILKLGKALNDKRENMFDIKGQDIEKGVKIIFSSGTTGNPKAILLSQKNLFFNYDISDKLLSITDEDSYYLFLPLHHVYGGVSIFLYSLIAGFSMYLCSDKTKMIEEIQETNPTIFAGVPLVYHMFYKKVDGNIEKLKSLFGKNNRYIFCSGANFDKKIKESYICSGLNMVESYGMTETCGVVATQNCTLGNIEAVGTIVDGIDVKIINQDEEGYGEVLVKSDGVFLEYYGDEELTSQVKDEEGFYHTGDIARISDKEMYYKKRKDRMFVTVNGENIDPLEIENLIMNFGKINKVKVFLEEKDIKAILYTDYELNGEEIIASANKKLPKYKHIRRWELIEDSLDVRYK